MKMLSKIHTTEYLILDIKKSTPIRFQYASSQADTSNVAVTTASCIYRAEARKAFAAERRDDGIRSIRVNRDDVSFAGFRSRLRGSYPISPLLRKSRDSSLEDQHRREAVP
jgi:hypothetical protein